MTERRTGGPSDRVTVDHAERVLVRLPEGGFVLEVPGERPVRVAPAGCGLRIDGHPDLAGWSLGRAPAGEGFVVHSADGRSEAGWTMAPIGIDRDVGLRFLLLDDGRLFRMVLRGPRDPRYELAGWETPGAYLVARPEPRGFKLEPTAACGGITDLTLISILFSAEILECDNPLQMPQP